MSKTSQDSKFDKGFLSFVLFLFLLVFFFLFLPTYLSPQKPKEINYPTETFLHELKNRYANDFEQINNAETEIIFYTIGNKRFFELSQIETFDKKLNTILGLRSESKKFNKKADAFTQGIKDGDFPERIYCHDMHLNKNNISLKFNDFHEQFYLEKVVVHDKNLVLNLKKEYEHPKYLPSYSFTNLEERNKKIADTFLTDKHLTFLIPDIETRNLLHKKVNEMFSHCEEITTKYNGKVLAIKQMQMLNK